MRVPRVLAASAVRRVVCDGCREPFDCEGALDDGVGEAAPLAAAAVAAERPTPAPQAEGAGAARPARSRMPRWLSDPESDAWRYLSIPIAAAAVIGALLLIQSLTDSAPRSRSASTHAPGGSKGGAANAAGGGGAASADKGANPGQGSSSSNSSNSQAGSGAASGGSSASAVNGAEVITGPSYKITIPPGWHGTQPKSGATFAAAADDGTADASLFVRRDPGVSFSNFQSLSLAQAHQVADSVHVVKHAHGPGVELAAGPQPGKPAYDVTLLAAGPYRYYLATTVDPNASRVAVEGANIVHKSFVPVASGKSSR